MAKLDNLDKTANLDKMANLDKLVKWEIMNIKNINSNPKVWDLKLISSVGIKEQALTSKVNSDILKDVHLIWITK